MGCDFYTGSAHKWFVGPKEAGVLYVRRERAADLWASDVGVGWQSAVDSGARKFETLGQRDDSAVAAMGTTVDFHNTIAPERIETRIRALALALKKGLQDHIPGIKIHTPMDPEFSGGVVVAGPPGMDVPQAYEKLYREHHIAGAARGGEFTGIRLCPHIYNTMEEVERVVEVLSGMS
jgi:selenocysteine lyase/cysteine desulfurase